MAMNPSVSDKAQRLFEYIRQVFSIDLPVERDVASYSVELWWQGDIPVCQSCMVRPFHNGDNATESDDAEPWFSVTKHSYDTPPPLPADLQQWVGSINNPTKRPQPMSPPDPATVRSVTDPATVRSVTDPATVRSVTDQYTCFDDDPERPASLARYIEQQWLPWAEGVLPQHRANAIYDQLFALRQRLNIEGDRLEIMWGHLFLSWRHSDNNTIYHPLLLTPMNLNFDPNKRTITLTPSQTTPTRMDIDCLLDLSYPHKTELINYLAEMNSSDSLLTVAGSDSLLTAAGSDSLAGSVNVANDNNNALDCWDNAAMRHMALRITGLLSTAAASVANRYEDAPLARPDLQDEPTIYNAPVIFVRRRTLRLWVDDANKVAQSITDNYEIPFIIRALLGDNPPMLDEDNNPDKDGGELLLPLLFNDQQEEIVKNLTTHFGVLVQGPPGTGKSHTIANIVSSLLARGKTILVTSQTENALRVLRDYLPDGIKSLCVSQLGNDTESRRQLSEAIESIGKQYHQQNSPVAKDNAEDNIARILEELSALRQQHIQIVNQLRQWSELDSSAITIDGVMLKALDAAKECSEQQQQCNWFVDVLSPDTGPPLTNQQLTQMCNAIKEISPQDKLACSQYLPQLKQLMRPEDFTVEVRRLHGLRLMASETQQLRDMWGQGLKLAQEQDILRALTLIEESLLSLKELTEPWQTVIAELISTAEGQNRLWKEFLTNLRNLFETTLQSYQVAQAYKVGLVDIIAVDIDIFAALEELQGLVSNGKNPAAWFTRLTMSKTARFVYDTVAIDGFPLNIIDRIQAANAYFKYKQGIDKINVLWENAVVHLGAPRLRPSVVMQLADVDSNIKKITRAIQWKNTYQVKVKETLKPLGFNQEGFHRPAVLQQCIKALNGQLSEIRRKEIEINLSRLHQSYRRESLTDNAHRLWLSLAEAANIANAPYSGWTYSIEQYQRLYDEVRRLLDVQVRVDGLNELSQRLRSVAPHWYNDLEARARETGAQAVAPNWQRAWRWRRLKAWLSKLHERESVEDLQGRLRRVQRQEREKITQLVIEKAWQRLKIDAVSYSALKNWAEAMKRYGKGTGKNATRHLADAVKAMKSAIYAVPAWIMPLHRVVQLFPARPGIFDVVIIDEASQCDLRALSVLFRAKKVLVVGDPEQISPSNIGIDRNKVNNLIQQYLSDVAHSNITFSIDSSIYHICDTTLSLKSILLTEHFRCIPELIAFSNSLCPTYNGRLQPLRIPNPNDMLTPPVVPVYINNGFKTNNDINEPEAKALVEQLLQCCRSDRYSLGGKGNRVRTMGVISLLGEEQAKYIYKLIANSLDETEIDLRRLICGDAHAFQGDERDVMFLSMVVAPNAAFTALTKDSDRQRFNVACSRARDQVFLFHSVGLQQLRNPECVRYKLLQHYLSPQQPQLCNSLEELKTLAESVFEIEVGTMIIERGYKVIAQYKPFIENRKYRIDLVVQGHSNRVAVECDGDRWHGPERWQYDHRRQCQLERAGWKFWRISGSSFYRDKEKAMSSLWKFLDAEGIKRQVG
ncbi:MAG: AAA family ATPase [Nitrospirae bacterium]|nr:AAA family ATPase [Nitrospirota bacterium]MBF0591474.1 AAA family ATPase [Nitrospirota bacterium]